MGVFLLALVLLVSVGFALRVFAGSSFETGVAVAGALGGGLLGLTVFRRVWCGPLWRGATALMGAQALYLVLWIAEGLLRAGPPHFASPLRLSLAELQGRWTWEDGQIYEVRGTRLCPVGSAGARGVQSDEHPPADSCPRILPEGRRLNLLMDDLALPLRAYRRWGREYLDAGLFDLKFSRPVPER